MKKKKLCFSVVLLLTLCLLCTSCYPAADLDGKFDPPQSTAALREGSWDYNLADVPYAYCNALCMQSGSFFCDYGPKILFTAGLNPAILYEYDKRTGTIDTFCKDATCHHDTPECCAYDVLFMELYQGEVYAYSSYFDPEKGISLETVLKLENGKFKPIVNPVYDFVHYNNDLLVVAVDGTVLQYPPDYKNPKTLLETFPYPYSIPIGHYLYYTDFTSIYRMNLDNVEEIETVVSNASPLRTDGEYLYYTDKDDSCLMRCDLDGKNIISLTEFSVRSSTINYDEEYLYFTGYNETDITDECNHKLYRLKRDLSKEPELLADIGFYISDIYTVYQFDALFLMQNADDIPYIINKDGTGLQKLDLPV